MAIARSPLVVLAIAVPTITILSPILFLTYKRRSLLASGIEIKTTVDTPAPSEDITKSLPKELKDKPQEWIISHEAASKVVPRSTLQDLPLQQIIINYLRANMKSFTYTPQSPLLKSMISSLSGKESFSHSYLSNLTFEHGDLVCGVFRVALEESSGLEARIELALDPDESFKGPKSEGRVVAKVFQRGGDVVFLNDTIMWRKRIGGKPEIIESAIGKWLHETMVLWLMDSGVKYVTKS